MWHGDEDAPPPVGTLDDTEKALEPIADSKAENSRNICYIQTVKHKKIIDEGNIKWCTLVNIFLML